MKEKQRLSDLRVMSEDQLEQEIVATTLESWLKIYERDRLFTYLLLQQDVLVSDEAIALLQQLCAEAESTSEDGRAGPSQERSIGKNASDRRHGRLSGLRP